MTNSNQIQANANFKNCGILFGRAQKSAKRALRRKNKRLATEGLRKRLDVTVAAMTALSFTVVAILAVCFIAWLASAGVDWTLSREIWRDIMDSQLGGIVVAILRVSLAILASALLAEPLKPHLRSWYSDGASSLGPAAIIIEDESKSKWYSFAGGMGLLIVLVLGMWKTSQIRVEMAMQIDLLPASAFYQVYVPPVATFIECIIGIPALEFMVYTVTSIRKRLADNRLVRLLDKESDLKGSIRKYLGAIDMELAGMNSGYTWNHVFQASPALTEILDDMDIAPTHKPNLVGESKANMAHGHYPFGADTTGAA